MAFLGIGIDSLEEKVQHGLIYDAAKKKQKDAKDKAKDKADKKIKNALWKETKALYEQTRNAAITEVANCKVKHWEAFNKTKKTINDSQSTEKQKEIDEAKKLDEDAERQELTAIIKKYELDITTYIELAKELKPTLGKNLTVENQSNYILTQGEQQFAQKLANLMKIAKQMAKLKSLQLNQQFDLDKINQELSNIPLKVEETIDTFKTILETLLGKITAPMFQPDLPEFNLDAILAQIKVVLNPVIASTKPLTAVVGSIPILGDLAGLLQMMASGSGNSSISKEDLKKLLPKKPELDPQLLEKLKRIGDDILIFVMTLPTILIQVIMAMIDTIYSKLSIITSVIPLGNMFPLNLIPAAITSGPKILTLMKTLPGMVWDMVKGLIMDKLWEAMALAFPTPNLDMDSLIAAADDINEQKNVKKAKTKEKRDYNDVTQEVYDAFLSSKGYTLLQAKTIQKNYKAIHNGTDTKIVKIGKYTNNEKEQNLPNQTLNSLKNAGISMLNGITSMATLNYSGTNVSQNELDESKLEYGYKIEEIDREKPSVEKYETYIYGLIAKSDLSAGLKYDKIKTTQAVVGEWYETYKDQLKDKGYEIVLEDMMKPRWQRKMYLNGIISSSKN